MSPLCRDRNGSCNQGTRLPRKTPALLGFASCRTLVWSCNSLPNLCWPHTWQSQCTHPISHSAKCPDACGHPGCRGRGASDAQPSSICWFRASRKFWGRDHGAAMTAMPTHCKGRLGARISSCVSSVRPCPVIGFTVCPDGHEGRRCCVAWVSLPTPRCL